MNNLLLKYDRHRFTFCRIHLDSRFEQHFKWSEFLWTPDGRQITAPNNGVLSPQLSVIKMWDAVTGCQSSARHTSHSTHKIPLQWSHWAGIWLAGRGNVGRLPLARTIYSHWYRLDPPLKGWLDHGWPALTGRPGPDSGHQVVSGQCDQPMTGSQRERINTTNCCFVQCFISFSFMCWSNMLHCLGSKWGSRILSEWATFLITIQTREKSHGFRFQTGFNGFTYIGLNKIGKVIKWIVQKAFSSYNFIPRSKGTRTQAVTLPLKY